MDKRYDDTHDLAEAASSTGSSIEDLTGRRRSWTAAEDEEKYRLVVENANEIITVTVDGNLSYVNQKAVEISGYTRDECAVDPG